MAGRTRDNSEDAKTKRESLDSLFDVHRELGLQKGKLRQVIASLESGHAIDQSDPKERLYAYQSIIISEIWKTIAHWIATHKSVYGLGILNRDDLCKALMGHGPETVQLAALERSELDRLRRRLQGAASPERMTEILSSRTCDVMLFHLFAWERTILADQFTCSRIPRSLYRDYLNELHKYRTQLAHFTYFATASMRHGFSFGQSLIWRIFGIVPRLIECSLREEVSRETLHETAQAILPFAQKLAATHIAVLLPVLGLIQDQSGQFKPGSLEVGRDKTGKIIISLSQSSVLRRLMSDAERLRSDFSAFSAGLQWPIDLGHTTVGCPALYSDSIRELHAWIFEIAEHLLFPVIVDQPKDSTNT